MSRVGTVISSHLTGTCGLRGVMRVGCMDTGTPTAATPEATVQLSLTNNRQCLFTPNPRPTPGPLSLRLAQLVKFLGQLLLWPQVLLT